MNQEGLKRLVIVTGILLLSLAGGLLYFSGLATAPDKDTQLADRIEKQMGKMDRAEKKAARSEYFFRLMRDPATNSIPENIRNRELTFARTLPTIEQVQSKMKAKDPSFQAVDYSWSHAGPFDVGGRTRALAVDRRNPDIILSGGVSGGMWKSTNGGDSWNMMTPDLANLSVTSVAQDPGTPDTWYYASGEILGNSASANNSAPYYGQGIYKSTDNGSTWSLLPQASSNVRGLVDPYNTVSRVIVSPTTSTVLISSNGFGIYRSTDGETFSGPVLGTQREQLFCDVAVASDGTLAAVISEASFDDQQSTDPSSPNHSPGVFISTDDGQNWTEVTPDTYPDTYRRSVLSFAPSNPDILYVLTLKGANDSENQGVSFHKIDLAAGSAEDRSEHLPDFRNNEDDPGYMELQGGYNMEVAVKPDDENFVLVGGINLFRSTDGFATTPEGGYDGENASQKDQYWIGGYNKDNSFAQYPNQHADQHRVIFPEPSANPDRMWAGHDGGLSYTADVTAESVSWESRNDGYVTSQFYAAAIPNVADDNRRMGGTQDNGTPFFRSGAQDSRNTQDISSGDGGYSYFTENYLYVSQQEGGIIRWEDDFSGFSYVYPSGAENQLFIHPYLLDPNDDNIMYYSGGSHIWRNTSLNTIPNNNSSSGTTEGWEELSELSVGSGYVISALEVSTVPAHVLYLGGYNSNNDPVIKRIENAHTATDNIADMSLPTDAGLSGAYLKDITVNPGNANEVLAVLSNYNIVGLYHTTDGGENWTAVEGNLTGNDTNPGPSLRSAAIIPAENGTVYLLGTSTGLYSTQALDGANTEWGQEASDVIGNVVTEDVAARIADGDIAAGTHGRGMLSGDFGGTVDISDLPWIELDVAEQRVGGQLIIRAVNFDFNTTASENEVILTDQYNNQTRETEATVLEASASELIIEVPRDAIFPEAPDNEVMLKIRSNNTEPSAVTFTVLPPTRFALNQNYPNPFRGATNIPFDVSEDSEVSLAIYSINGQEVIEPLRSRSFNAGSYDEEIDLSHLASGVYIYRLVAQSENRTQMDSKKMTLIK